MKKLTILVLAAFAVILAGCGASSQTASATAADGQSATVVNIKTQTDPLIVTLTDFDGRSITGDRCFIALVGGTISGKIPSLAGMVGTRGVAYSGNALIFEKAEARISEPHIAKNGKSYSFEVIAREATFFNRWTTCAWRISYTVYTDGAVRVMVESDEIGRLASHMPTWRFDGEIDTGRTEAAELILKSGALN